MLLDGISVSVRMDARRTGTDRPAPLRLVFNRRGRTAEASLGVSVLPRMWDSAGGRITIEHPGASALNLMLGGTVLGAEAALFELALTPDLRSSDLVSVRDAVIARIDSDPHFFDDVNVDRIRSFGMLMLYREQFWVESGGRPAERKTAGDDGGADDDFFRRNWDDRGFGKKGGYGF